MKIYFVRHGQTQANIDKVEYTLDDNKYPLTELGKTSNTFWKIFKKNRKI